MLKLIIPYTVVLVGLLACSSDSVTDNVPLTHKSTPVVVPQIHNTKPPMPTPTLHPLISGKTPPAVNLPTPKPTSLPEKPFIPLLPATDTPVLVSAVNTMNIAYRLPSSMNALPERTFAGSVTMKEETTYATAHKMTAVNDEIGLLLAQVFDSTETPIILDVGSGVTISQTPVSVPEDSNALDVPVNVSTNLGSSTVVPGQTLTVQGEIGNFQIHLQESGYYLADPYSTDPFTGYRTHLWVVRTD